MLGGSSWRQHRLLVVCYHGVSKADECEWSVPYLWPERLRSRLQLIRESQCAVLTLSDAVQRLYAGTLPRRSVVVTFDEGAHDFLTRAYPLLREFAMPATLYVTSRYTTCPYPVFEPMTYEPAVEQAVCDFMAFGRLETSVGGQKVVISGNAGGRNADGSIKGETEVSIRGTKYHVHDIDSYGPIASGTLATSSYRNSRVFSGMGGGKSVELRLWDNGETGKGVDRVSLTIGGSLILGSGVGGITLDEGNAQYHASCRGPKD